MTKAKWTGTKQEFLDMMEPEMTVVWIDETHYWTSLPKGVTEIYGVYLIDKSRHTYCCSVTPSWEAWFVCSYPVIEEDHDSEPIEEWIREHDCSEWVSYFTVGSTFDKERELPINLYEEDNFKQMEETLEYIVANGEYELN